MIDLEEIYLKVKNGEINIVEFLNAMRAWEVEIRQDTLRVALARQKVNNGSTKVNNGSTYETN